MEKEEGGRFKKQRIMISVIITTHAKRSKLCKKAIKSVLAQTYQDFELIVVDDASVDDTEAMVKSFKDKRIRYFKLKRSRKKQAVPKNKGTREAVGEYIAYLDSDNTYRPDHLQVLLSALKGGQHQIAYGDRWMHVGKKQEIGYFNDYNLGSLLERNFIDTSDALIKREAMEYIGGWDERYKRFSDWNLYLRMGKAGFRFIRVPQVITDYYVRKDNLSHVVENVKNPMRPLWNPYDCEIRLSHLGKITQELRVAVFTITYGRLAYTKKSFKSLKKTAGYPYDHFVIDNGSSDGTGKWLKKQKVTSILNKDNKGISIASNQALELIKRSGRYDIIVKFDNDCMCLSEGWLKKMIEIYESNHMIALSPYVQGLRDNPGGSPRYTYGKMSGELIGMAKHLGGICHFVSSKAYEDFRWPETEQLHGVQDVEFSRHLFATGYQMGYLENYFVSHGPLGTEKQQKDYPEYFERRKKEKVTKYDQ